MGRSFNMPVTTLQILKFVVLTVEYESKYHLELGIKLKRIREL